jgi:hypothetical protein
MKVRITRATYSVKWVHVNPVGQFHVGEDERIDQIPGKPTCTVCFLKKGVMKSSGVAKVHPKDMRQGRFNPDTGRKLSLSRALDGTRLTKPFRKLFWDAYLGK